MSKKTTVKARALRDEPAHGLRCGQLAELDPAIAEQLAASGAIDTNTEAVKAALAEAPAAAPTDVIEAED